MGLRKYQEKGADAYPNIGKLVRKAMLEKGISKAELARRMGINPTSINGYLDHSSLQLGIIWNLGIALQHDFLLEIANHYPSGFALNQNSNIIKELNEKNQKITDLEKEIEIYKNALGIKN